MTPNRRRGLALTLIAAALVVGPLPASTGAQQASAPKTEPYLAHDAAAQFHQLSLRPDGLGFSLGDHPPAGVRGSSLGSAPEPDMCRHLQGIARYQSAGGDNYLFVTRSGNFPLGCSGNDGVGNLFIVKMGSREPTGERMRSNRLGRDWPKPPDARDRVVKTIYFDGSATADGDDLSSLRYAHPGGMQLIGDVLVIALESPLGADPSNTIAFVDVSDPENPELRSTFSNFRAGAEFSAGLVGVTPIETPDGRRYVMVVAGLDNKDVRFYRSLSGDLAADQLGWEEIGSFSEHEINACFGFPDGPGWPNGSGKAHQTLNFVRDRAGGVYLLGVRNTGTFASGDDMLDLYSAHLAADGFMPPCPLSHRFTTHVDSAPYIIGDDSINGQAAAGAYVSPSGELIVYVTEIENDGPEVEGRQTVRLGEFRNRIVVDGQHSPTLMPGITATPAVVDEGASAALSATGSPPATKAWIQLYEDDGAGTAFPGNASATGDSWVNVDYPDRSRDRFGDLVNLLDHDETTGSWRWFAPVGCTILAHDEPTGSSSFPGANTVALRGSGLHEVETDLDALRVYDPDDSTWPVSPVPAGEAGHLVDYDDAVGGITFGADCDDYYNAQIGVAWDLDGDGVFETGQPATFDAAQLDGPTTRSVAARGQHPTDPTPLGTGAPVPVEIQVSNVAPRVRSAAVNNSLGNGLGTAGAFALAGLPLTLEVTFTDPGAADTQTAAVAWDDGTTDTTFDSYSDARGGSVGRLVDSHTFASPGTFEIVATITDDDGDATQASITVEVVSPVDAIENVADDLTARIAAAANPAIAYALRAARDDLIGNHEGTPPTNGAVDKLAADDPLGAITKLRSAISYLALAELSGADDQTAIKDLLGLVAEALATGVYHEATSAVGPPSAGEARTLAAISALLGQAHQQLSAGQYSSACDSFRQATAKALNLLK